MTMDKGDFYFGLLIVGIGAGAVGAIVGMIALGTWTVKTVWGA